MRRDSSTVVAAVGEVSPQLLADVGRSANVAVAQTVREAARKSAAYVLVTADPLAGVAEGWRGMWDLTAADTIPFETSAAEVLTAWRAGGLDLPDYYVVVEPAEAEPTGPDLYLGPLRSARPRRVELVAAEPGPPQAEAVRQVLGHLHQSPWWPPLDELIDAARHFFPGGMPTP